MVMWKQLADDNQKSVWDKNLLRFSDHSLFQTFAWGEYKRSLGWIPNRWIAVNEDNEIIAMVQGLLREFPFKSGIVWAPGGPVGDISAIGEGFFDFMKAVTGLKRIFCRFYLSRENNSRDAGILENIGISRADCRINKSGMSMTLDLNCDEEEFLRRFSKNWGHNYRRSRKYEFSIKLLESPDIDELLCVYRDMEDKKKLDRQYSRVELENLFEKLGDNIILYGCRDSSGELIGFRGCAVSGKKGWDLLAATSSKGRRVYAAYALFVELMRRCRELGLSCYDMSGIDSVRSRGVYDFKKGTGAKTIEYLGEWDWASPSWLSCAVNFAVRKRAGYL